MATCHQCGSTILFGGTRVGELRYCGKKCQEKDVIGQMAVTVPEELLAEHVQNVHAGPCPLCHGRGPVDVHTSHQVISALVVTTWKSYPKMSCRGCGVKRQARDILISLVAGWWGFPWGLIMTPVQVGRNVYGIVKGPDPSRPSPALHAIVRRTLAEEVVRIAREEELRQKVAV